ncbi:NAD(P)/FAD-dependent oxidoreductase [Chryseolinea sp. T2]|uniref:FAD-dependent oxidoreductase n=1 Tax=Chryseolinea sp. T2 TaxID=3129255 RepID=UPI0030784487
MKNILKDRKVAIAGGGPAGLTLARLLQLKGISVSVYERDADKSVRQQGATLDLHEDSGLAALKKAGLLDEFRKLYRPGADKMRITDEHGTIVHDDHDQKPEDDFGNEHFRPEIDRGPLRDMLIDSLIPGTIQWNSHFKEMKPSGNGWELLFANGGSEYADIVIATDGANSKLRKYVTDIEPLYSGITIIEGNIYNAAVNAPKLWALTKGGKVFAMGEEKTIILSAKGDGSLSFYTGTKESEHWATQSGIDFSNRHQLIDWFRGRYAEWSDIWLELFNSDDAYFVARPQYYCPYDQSWNTNQNITLIGDAAHRMPPYAGEGVNMAMQDALELYEALCESDFDTTTDALRHFESNMLKRAAEVTFETMESTERMHSKGALQKLLAFFTEAALPE